MIWEHFTMHNLYWQILKIVYCIAWKCGFDIQFLFIDFPCSQFNLCKLGSETFTDILSIKGSALKCIHFWNSVLHKLQLTQFGWTIHYQLILKLTYHQIESTEVYAKHCFKNEWTLPEWLYFVGLLSFKFSYFYTKIFDK